MFKKKAFLYTYKNIRTGKDEKLIIMAKSECEAHHKFLNKKVRRLIDMAKGYEREQIRC